MTIQEMQSEIMRLKKENDICILAHSYQGDAKWRLRMTLEEVRKMIDCVDTQIKPLFLERMACAEHVAAAKAENGSDVRRALYGRNGENFVSRQKSNFSAQ